MVGKEIKDKSGTENMTTYPKSSYKLKWNKMMESLPPHDRMLARKPIYFNTPPLASDDLDWSNSPLPIAGGFQSPMEKLAFFDKECSKIVDYIFLGSDFIASNRDVLLQNGITHVLNCVGFVCPEYFKDDFVYKTLWLHDSPWEDITSILYDVFDYFEDVREQGGRVFVHCRQGVSRSTSLVIAYLMWKEEQRFEVAFQHVKAARGVTNPNMGFASQLLECQKNLHALPASPNSMIRMYRMAPHCSYDPLHLVPKRLTKPSAKELDSRGAFIIHIPSAIYIWVGNRCISMMEENAKGAASQLIRYEKAKGPAMVIKEGEEPFEFWEALGVGIVDAINSADGQRHVQSYNTDFKIFHKAVSGGVLPPFPLSGNQTVTCLPARENGWRKFISGIIKDLITSTKIDSITQGPSLDIGIKNANDEDVYHPTSPVDPSSTLDCAFGQLAPAYDSPFLSPSNSGSSTPFTFSPSSSNSSDFSYLSTIHSPNGLEGNDSYHCKVSSPSLTEGRGNIPVLGTMLHSVPSASQNLQILSRSYSFSRIDPEEEIMKDVDCQKPEEEDSVEMKNEGSIPDTDNKNETVKFRSSSKARNESFFPNT